MAESKNNIVTHGLSGKIGDLLVFRNRAGKTIVASAPKERTGEPTEAQKQHQLRFQEAILYAQGVLSDPERKAAYKSVAGEGVSAYNVAVADFMHAPDIHHVDVSGYTGKAGDSIMVEVTDDFRVSAVTVTILNADGSEVEHGNAMQQANTTMWLYIATAANDTLAGDKITIRAYDLPGHISLQEQAL
jgi:hypothetical protein